MRVCVCHICVCVWVLMSTIHMIQLGQQWTIYMLIYMLFVHCCPPWIIEMLDLLCSIFFAIKTRALQSKNRYLFILSFQSDWFILIFISRNQQQGNSSQTYFQPLVPADLPPVWIPFLQTEGVEDILGAVLLASFPSDSMTKYDSLLRPSSHRLSMDYR